MYKLSYFTETDEGRILEFMKAHPFAFVIGTDDHVPAATHVPLQIKIEKGKIILTGHIMIASDHFKVFSKNENVLVIFSGANSYVSAGWYVKKNVASTWNYMDVHAKGKITFVDEAATREIVKNITSQYERPESEAAFDKLPAEYVDRLVKAIIGFQIEVETLENVFKLSQNHDLETRKEIIENLKKTGDSNSIEIASEMEKRL